MPRIHGVFAAGNILNRKTAHSQLMGGMIWGISSALHEHTLVDHARARFLNTDIAEYLVPVNADIREVNVAMLDEHDDQVNPLGVKGIVGTAAAVANAIQHATGKRLSMLRLYLIRQALGSSGLLRRLQRDPRPGVVDSGEEVADRVSSYLRFQGH